MTVLLSETANRGSISLRTALDPGLPATTADRILLQQVLMNPMINGIEAMRGTGGELTVTSKRNDDGQLLISVTDSGTGLPDDSERSLTPRFELFQESSQTSATAPNTKARASASPSADFCQIMGGDIRVQGGPGRGLTFTIRCQELWTLRQSASTGLDPRFASSDIHAMSPPGTEADAITSEALSDFVQSVLDGVSDHRHDRSAGHCRQLAKRSN